MKFKIGGKQFQVLPAISINYLLYSVVFIFAFFWLIDQFVLTYLEDQGKICSAGWREDNSRINLEMGRRNRASDQDPIWQSEGWPVAEKCPVSKRIMVMGDSFVWGTGYANMNTIWWRQLGRELQRRGYNDVEVMAAGMPGAPTRKELGWAKHYVPIYKPDALIWGYVTNDAEEGSKNGIGLVKTSRLPEDDFPPRVKTALASVFPNIGDEFSTLRAGNRTRKLSGEVFGWDFSDWELKLLEGKNWDVYHDTVKQLGEYVNELPIPSFVVTLPSCIFDTRNLAGRNLLEIIRDYYVPRYTPVQKLFEQNHIKWYDLLDQFLAFIKPDPRIYKHEPPLWLAINPANGHPGPQACYVHAVETANILEAHYPQCLGKKSMPVDVVKDFRVNDWLPFDISFKQNKNQLFFVYPENDQDLLTMPIRKPFVEFNFEHPVPVKQVTITGAQLANAEISFTADGVDQHFDDGTVTSCGEKRGNTITWNLPDGPRASHMNTLRVSAHFKGRDHRLLMNLVTQ
ncbi:MAG TPA: SGNH/GDSL hydrolase family protein [Drouetiella sp.]